MNIAFNAATARVQSELYREQEDVRRRAAGHDAAVADRDLSLGARMLPDGRVVLAFTGRLTAATAPAVRARVRELADEGHTRIVCDLSRVDALDSSGLAALIAGVRAARERGGFFRFVVRTKHVAHMFALTTLDRVFELHPSVEAALGAPRRRRTDRAGVVKRPDARLPSPWVTASRRTALRLHLVGV